MKRIRGVVATFLIVCLGIVGVDVNFNESRASLKAVATVSLASQTFSNPTFTGAVTASQVTGMERVLAQWGVPVILASSGTMGNNGAVSGMTALPRTYSGGAWLYLPAGAVAAGEPATAAFRWFVASSTTAGTVYNSSWDGTGIPTAGTTTAYSTTGPGAFTGVATGQIVALTITVPAGALGPNGTLRVNFNPTINTAAGNKIFRARIAGAGGTVILQSTASTTDTMNGYLTVTNLGVSGAQRTNGYVLTSNSLLGLAPVFLSEDLTSATTVILSMEKATATNHAIIDGGDAVVIYGS